MTPVEIAYFKHYLYDKGLERSFLHFFRKYGYKKNPESVEQYFLESSVEDVLMKAFYFTPTNGNGRSNYNYDYWKDIDEKWQVYMRDNASNFSNDAWPLLNKTFAILRQNWDLPKYFCRENLESTEEVYERMHINLPLPEWKWKHGGMVRYQGDGSLPTDSGNEELKEENDQPPLIDFFDNDDDDPFSDFEFLETSKTTAYRLKPNELSINSNKSNKITFNMKESLDIDKTKMKFAALASRNGDIFLILNNVKGVRITYDTHKQRQRQNVTINSKDLCDKIKTHLDINLSYDIITYERIESSLTRIIFKLNKP